MEGKRDIGKARGEKKHDQQANHDKESTKPQLVGPRKDQTFHEQVQLVQPVQEKQAKLQNHDVVSTEVVV